MAQRKVRYSDINLSTSRRVVDLDAVKAAVLNLFLISPREVINNPSKGLDIERYLFETTFSGSRFILDAITRGVSRLEFRAEVLPESEVEVDEDNRAYNINLLLKVEGLERPVEVNHTLQVMGG